MFKDENISMSEANKKWDTIIYIGKVFVFIFPLFIALSQFVIHFYINWLRELQYYLIK